VKERRRSIAEDRRWGREPHLACSSKLLREARQQAGLGLRAVCDATGLSPAQLSDMERGIGTTPLHRVAVLCEALSMAPEPLVAAILQDQLITAGLSRIVVKCEQAENDSSSVERILGLAALAKELL